MKTRTWSEVENILVTNVIQNMQDPTRGQKWMGKLKKYLDGEALGICLAIDLVTGSLDKELVIEILDTIDLRYRSSLAFQKAVDAFQAPSKFIIASNFFEPRLRQADRYMRVLSLPRFVSYYLQDTYGLTTDPVDLIDARRMFFQPDGKSLGEIRNWWSGYRCINWVIKKSDIDKLIPGFTDSSDIASRILDALGLSTEYDTDPDHNEMVAVMYPRNFDQSIKCTQPSTFDTTWSNTIGYYLSYKNYDSWGRTQSCSGTTYSEICERVHSMFKGLTDKYVTVYFGFAVPPIHNRSAFLSEGYHRLSEVLT